jgi:Asp/Glu/hydantoin racemase
MKTYWVWVNCRWVRRTTSLAIWAAMPAATIGLGCAGAGALTNALRHGLQVPPSQIQGQTIASVPEPASAPLLALGCLALGFALYLSRRRKTHAKDN